MGARRYGKTSVLKAALAAAGRDGFVSIYVNFLGVLGARERYGISKTGSNKATIERLERSGHLVADETTATGWRILDPLLELWLANGRTWPTPN